MEIKILIADDHKVVCEAISCLLNKESDMKVIGEAEDGRVAVQRARELRPDVILMDVEMPNLSGIEATRQIVRELPDVKVLAFSAHLDNRSVREMLKAGASGYVPKHCDFKELATAIRSVVSNHTYLSSKISGVFVEEYVHRMDGHDASAYSILTTREREVLQLVAEGKSAKDIAKELHVSAKTVEWHRSQIMKKLGIRSIAQLVKYAINEGLTCAYT